MVIKMVVTYDIDRINTVLEDFYRATDTNINLLDADFSYMGGRIHRENNLYCKYIQDTPDGIRECRKCDGVLLKKCRETKKPQMQLCHAGLIDAAAPILYEDEIIGYVIFGEMKPDINFEDYREHIEKLGLDSAEMEKHYMNNASFESHRILGIVNVASMLAKYILLENYLTLNYGDVIEKAVSYIDENLSGDLSIYALSKAINTSKSVIYKRFHKEFNTTVGEFINRRRIEKSMKLLKNTDLSIEEVSQMVGFSTASYYSKTFRKNRGISPLKYKKGLQKQ